MGQLNKSLRNLKSVMNTYRTLKKVNVAFDPFCPESRSTKEFLSALLSPKVRGTVPDMKVSYQILSNLSLSPILIEFIDGSKMKINAKALSSTEILEKIEKTAKWKVPGSSNPFP